MVDDFDFKKERKNTDKKITTMAGDFARTVHQKGINSLDRSKVLAETLVELQTDKRGASLIRCVDLEWMVDALVSRSIPQCMDELIAMYDAMEKHGFVNGKKFVWNDADNWITIHNPESYPHVMTFGSQNFSWIAIFDDIYGDGYRIDISVYRMYEVPLKDHMMCDPINGETKIEYAQRATDTFEQYYTDNTKRNTYVQRPDFKWFEDCDFKHKKIEKNCFMNPVIKYDSFYYDTFDKTEAKYSMYNLSGIWCLFFETETAVLAIEEEPDFQK